MKREERKKLEEQIIYDFIKWSEKMEPKYDLNAVDIEDVVRRHLNRVHAWSIKIVKEMNNLPKVEVPEKYRNADWLIDKIEKK